MRLREQNARLLKENARLKYPASENGAFETGTPTRPVCGAPIAHNEKLSRLIRMVLKKFKRADVRVPITL